MPRLPDSINKGLQIYSTSVASSDERLRFDEDWPGELSVFGSGFSGSILYNMGAAEGIWSPMQAASREASFICGLALRTCR